MVSFYYKVGYIETVKPWYLPKFDFVKSFLTEVAKDDELKIFSIFVGGQILYNWNSWSVDLFLEYEDWQTNLDFVFLERMMAKIYKIAFDMRILVDVTFCGKHQYSDLYNSAKNRVFAYPSFNNSQFIKFDHIVKTVDGKSTEKYISWEQTTTKVTEYLVLFANTNRKYPDSLISKNSLEKYIYKEGISIDFFISLSQNEFELTKKNPEWGVNLNTNTLLNQAATASITFEPMGATGP